LQTLLLFLLTNLAAFGFVSGVVEYLTVRMETMRLSEYYQYVGVLLPKDSEQTDVTDGARLLEDNPRVAYTDWRRVAIGMLPEGMTNADTDGNSGGYLNEYYENLIPFYEDYEDVFRHNMTYLNDILFYGTVQSRDIQTVFNRSNGEDVDIEVLTLAVDEILGGGMYWFNKGGKFVSVRVPCPPLDVLEAYPFLGLQIGERYLLRARLDSNYRTLCFIPLQPNGPPYLPVAEGSVDLDDDDFNILQADLALLHANLRCMTLISTRDMHAIPERWEGGRRLALDKGRWLTKEDNVNERYVCMLHQGFAERRGLSVGDVISLQVWDSRQLAYINVTTEFEVLSVTWERTIVTGNTISYPGRYDGYMTAVDFETAAIAPELLELEVVGIFGRRTEMNIGIRSAESNEIYIPEFCMPAEFGGETLTNAQKFLFSFVLRSHRDKNAFMEETREELAAMGLSVSFVDSNAEAFWNVMEPLMESKLFSLYVYSLLLMLALILMVFLYLRPRRKEFAVLRTLGLSRSKARYALGLPIALIGTAGVATGGTLGWNYALAQAAETLPDFQQEEMVAFIPPSPVWLAALCLGALVLLMLIAYAGITIVSRKSVLQLLHGSGTAPHGKNS